MKHIKVLAILNRKEKLQLLKLFFSNVVWIEISKIPQNKKIKNVTIASSVINKLVALVAITVVANGCIDTSLRASAIVFGTFVLSTSIARLVLEVRAVGFLVAYFRQRYAHAAAAVKLCFLIAYWFGFSWKKKVGIYNVWRPFILIEVIFLDH